MVPTADLVAVLKHPPHLDALLGSYPEAAVLDALRREGIAPYVAWLRPDVGALADDRRRAVLDAAVRHTEMVRVCDALVQAAVTPLIFKGGAWAYTEYPEPWCRPHIDLDVLVAPDARHDAGRALERLGYRRAERIPGSMVNGQDVFELTIIAGTTTTVDLHWHLSNRQWLQHMLPTDAVIARGVPAPFAGAGVLRACDEDSVFIASLHPRAHHAKDATLKWSLDLALMATRWSGPATAALQVRAAHLGASALVARALRDARALVADDALPLLSAAVIDGLDAAGAHDASRVWLDPRRDQLQDALDDLRALSSWREKRRLLREHLWPPAPYLLAHYGTTHRVWLPWLYVHRLMTGGTRWIGTWVRDRLVSRSAASRGPDRDSSADRTAAGDD
jgi:hypothetical protein